MGMIDVLTGKIPVTLSVDVYADDQDSLLCADVAFDSETETVEVYVLEECGSLLELEPEAVNDFILKWTAIATRCGAAFKVSDDALDAGLTDGQEGD